VADFGPTKALGRAILFVGALMLAAALFGRFDLVVLAAPFAIGTAVSVIRRPRVRPTAELSTVEPFVVEGGDAGAATGVGNPGSTGYDLAIIRVRSSYWVDLEHADRPYATTVAPGTMSDIDLNGRVTRWGRHTLGPVTAHAVGGDGLFISRGARTGALTVKAYPVTEVFDADEAMPRAAGHVGGHRSRRPGEGGEIAGVRKFGPGDRLRRIDWRVSLRTRELHVVATLSDRDAEVVLLLDVLHEAGRSGGVDGNPSVLDTTVRAAAGIAEHYLHRGDRVSLVQYGYQVRRLRAGSGRRHYLTTLEWLLDVAPTGSTGDPPATMFGPHVVPGNALVMVLTPLIDVRSAGMLANLVRAGRFVLAVDTLPADLADPSVPPPGGNTGRWTANAHRLWLLERANLVGQLREVGVPVVQWGGAGSLDEVLRGVARVAVSRTVPGAVGLG
jgi:uncharacterized protein (DUF58 family)